MAFSKTITVLDIGSYKITCAMGKITNLGTVEIETIAFMESKGITRGVITNMAEAEKSIAKCIENVEQKSGNRITSVSATISGLTPRSHWVQQDIIPQSRQISETDVNKLLHKCKKQVHKEETPLLHANPYTYYVDGTITQTPVGMVGKKLTAKMLMITSNSSAIENLKCVLDNCSVNINQIAISSYVTGLGVIDEEERDLSCIVLDIGARITSISVFYEGKFIHADSIPLGGDHITSDIMNVTSMSYKEAEQLKRITSAMVTDNIRIQQPVEYSRVGERNSVPNRISAESLTSIVQHRLEEIFTLIEQKLTEFKFARRMIITGGTSNIKLISELAEIKLKYNVRIGRPINTIGLTDISNTPLSSTAIGLLRYSDLYRSSEEIILIDKPNIYEGSTFTRICNWFKNEI